MASGSRAIPLLFLVSATFGSEARELLRDPQFQNGFRVLDPAAGRRVVRGTLHGPVEGEPAWDLAQWHSRHTIAGAQPERLPGGVVRFASPAKWVVVAPEGQADADLVLGVDTRPEWNDRHRQKGDGWPHLLVQQPLPDCPPLAALSRLDFHIEARLLEDERVEHDGYTPSLHCAQIHFVLIVQDRGAESPGRGDFLWFLVPLYDDRHRSPRPHVAKDTADPSAKLIVNPGGKAYTDRSLHDREWVTIDCDLRPRLLDAVRTAWDRGTLQKSRDLAAIRPTSAILGWEVPGIHRVAIQVRGLSLEATAATEGER